MKRNWNCTNTIERIGRIGEKTYINGEIQVGLPQTKGIHVFNTPKLQIKMWKPIKK